MGVPVLDLLNLLQGWQKYFLLLGVIALDTGVTGMIGLLSPIQFSGFLTAPINLVVQMVFGVAAFEITSFQLLIVCLVAPVFWFMLKMALNNAGK